jgi:phage tail-like protein
MNGPALNDDRDRRFINLNRDNEWLGLARDGLERRPDGALQLLSLPLLSGALPEQMNLCNEIDAPAGVAIDADGTIYYSDPANRRLLRVDGCSGEVSTVACAGGEGTDAGQFDTCRGLLLSPHRRALFVADSSNHRVQVFNLASWQVVEILDQSASAAEPYSGSAGGRLKTPWTLAEDRHGNVYVVDYEDRSIQKFDRAGELVPSFWLRAWQTHAIIQPVDIAVHSQGDEVRLYVIDEFARCVMVIDGDGSPVLDAHGERISFGSEQLRKPMGIAVNDDSVYVGDNERQRILRFERTGANRFAGEAVGYRGTVAALTLAGQESLLVHSGVVDLPPLKLAIGKGFSTRGVLWSSEAISAGRKVAWGRLQARLAELTSNAHLQLFAHVSNNPNDKPQVDPASANPFADPRWQSAGVTADIRDFFIGGAAAQFLWVGALFSGDGRGSPIVSQLRVEFDHDGYANDLPAIYRTETPAGEFLPRFLSLFETLFEELENKIGGLSRLFDPEATPNDFLPWLASWLALDLDENWSEQKQREMIAWAFEHYGRRGTVRGLREALLMKAGAQVIVEEPVLTAAWWSLPVEAAACSCGQVSYAKEKTWTSTETSVLGVSTMLASAQPQGAVLGTTATLDYSHLITNEEFGAPLFESVAHQFSVQVYRSQLHCADTLAELRGIVESEKPAHTDYHLCIIEPRMRVGFQSRVGIDAVIGGPPMQTRLGEGSELVLGGEPPGQIGENSRLGMTTRVG